MILVPNKTTIWERHCGEVLHVPVRRSRPLGFYYLPAARARSADHRCCWADFYRAFMLPIPLLFSSLPYHLVFAVVLLYVVVSSGYIFCSLHAILTYYGHCIVLCHNICIVRFNVALSVRFVFFSAFVFFRSFATTRLRTVEMRSDRLMKDYGRLNRCVRVMLSQDVGLFKII